MLTNIQGLRGRNPQGVSHTSAELDGTQSQQDEQSINEENGLSEAQARLGQTPAEREAIQWNLSGAVGGFEEKIDSPQQQHAYGFEGARERIETNILEIGNQVIDLQLKITAEIAPEVGYQGEHLKKLQTQLDQLEEKSGIDQRALASTRIHLDDQNQRLSRLETQSVFVDEAQSLFGKGARIVGEHAEQIETMRAQIAALAEENLRLTVEKEDSRATQARQAAQIEEMEDQIGRLTLQTTRLQMEQKESRATQVQLQMEQERSRVTQAEQTAQIDQFQNELAQIQDFLSQLLQSKNGVRGIG